MNPRTSRVLYLVTFIFMDESCGSLRFRNKWITKIFCSLVLFNNSQNHILFFNRSKEKFFLFFFWLRKSKEKLVMFSAIKSTTSVDANFPSILHIKNYFFYFTHPFLQNTHISLSILHIYSIKYSFFYHFLLSSNLLPLSLS